MHGSCSCAREMLRKSPFRFAQPLLQGNPEAMQAIAPSKVGQAPPAALRNSLHQRCISSKIEKAQAEVKLKGIALAKLPNPNAQEATERGFDTLVDTKSLT